MSETRTPDPNTEDLATLRSCAEGWQLTLLDRVEAENARLREELASADRVGTSAWSEKVLREREAAEAECARLRQALREIAERCESEMYADEEQAVYASQRAREALAGPSVSEPDTPAEWEARCHFCGGPSYPWLTDDETWAKVKPILGQQQACFECFADAWFKLGHNYGEPFHVTAGQDTPVGSQPEDGTA